MVQLPPPRPRLAALVIAIVGMIVPLPPALLDLLISINIAATVTLLLVSLYVADALKFVTFPTLLLLTTLYRLAIEVSATRLILLRADGGSVFRAFGRFVVSGNLMVGAVVFLRALPGACGGGGPRRHGGASFSLGAPTFSLRARERAARAPRAASASGPRCCGGSASAIC